MKFSDLVVLGSTIISLDSSIYLSEGCGCFIGMAAAAKTGATHYGDQQYRVMSLFPWLSEPKPNYCPCCGQEYRDYCTTIGCLAVHVQMRQMTFDNALEHIRSIEPGEEESQTVYGFLCPQRIRRVEEKSGKPVE